MAGFEPASFGLARIFPLPIEAHDVQTNLKLPRTGLEPARSYNHRVLSPVRLPVPPPRRRHITILLLFIPRVLHLFKALTHLSDDFFHTWLSGRAFISPRQDPTGRTADGVQWFVSPTSGHSFSPLHFMGLSSLPKSGKYDVLPWLPRAIPYTCPAMHSTSKRSPS